MSSKYVVKFYFTTLIIGVIASTFISLFTEYENCLLYTSDAADDTASV